MDIPKIIWQTHNYEFHKLPEHFKKVTRNWKNLNPGWEYRYVSHNQRIEAIKPYDILFESYLKQDPVTQSDIWRYIVTYEHGGVYADMDSVCIKPLDYLLEGIKDCELLVVPAHHNQGSFTNNANYAIKPRSNIMKNIIQSGEEYAKNANPNYEKHTWSWFMDVVEKSKNVSYEFTSARHTEELKTNFDSNFYIDEYGIKIKYEEFLKKHNLSII